MQTGKCIILGNFPEASNNDTCTSLNRLLRLGNLHERRIFCNCVLTRHQDTEACKMHFFQ